MFHRYYDLAPTIHALASEYHTDPYTAVFEWDLFRFDFNVNILTRAKAVEAEQIKKAQKRGKGR